jgi:hypothetical protein
MAPRCQWRYRMNRELTESAPIAPDPTRNEQYPRAWRSYHSRVDLDIQRQDPVRPTLPTSPRPQRTAPVPATSDRSAHAAPGCLQCSRPGSRIQTRRQSACTWRPVQMPAHHRPVAPCPVHPCSPRFRLNAPGLPPECSAPPLSPPILQPLRSARASVSSRRGSPSCIDASLPMHVIAACPRDGDVAACVSPANNLPSVIPASLREGSTKWKHIHRQPLPLRPRYNPLSDLLSPALLRTRRSSNNAHRP